jgi:Raf kinase inhibitor-like YbhB/YbcL family protein
MEFTLTSSAFREGETIPLQFTCEGRDTPPPLAWSDPPRGTQSLALVMDDPDAPRGPFTHWLLFDVPADAGSLPGDRIPGKTLRNGFGRTGYGGPCPPAGHGPHRYVFTLYAVDVLELPNPGTTRASLERALVAHTLGTARLVGRYERKR